MSQMNNPFDGFGGNSTGAQPIQPQASGGTTYDPFSQNLPNQNQQSMLAQNPPTLASYQSAPMNYHPQANQTFAPQPTLQAQTSSPMNAQFNVAYQQPPPSHQGQQQQYNLPPSTPQSQQLVAPNALVVSNQASNPYSLPPAPQAPTPVAAANPFSPSQSLVPAQQKSSPWAQQAQVPAPSPAANLFDPFAAPAPVPPPAPVPKPAPVTAMVAVPPAPTNDAYPQYSLSQPQQQFQNQAPPPYVVAPTPEPSAQNEHQIVPRNENGSTAYGNNFAPSPHENKYSQVLAATAPSTSAALPSSDKVVKSGFVLSRISFRTILLKKWKQTYWVQYGPHTMLWFRSHADFDDWLNNPYHTQQQRNFLIKLAVNFVHDLYKPNVRGYQVTQARRKQYKNQILKQFKLERWMDYGPTIAAAFASSDPKEVDELRQAIVECMRNTPVGDGIRATGAVRRESNQNSNPGPSGQFGRSASTSASAKEIREDHRAFDNQSSYHDAQSVPGNMAPSYNFAQSANNGYRGY